MGISAAFYRTLASYHRAGIAWPEAVEGAAGLAGGLQGAGDRLRQGMPLAEVLDDHADPIERALLRAGEASGSLESTLERIADTKEDEVRERKERRASIAYPVVLAHVAAVLMPIPDLIQQEYGMALFWAAAILVPLWSWLFLLRRLERTRHRHGESPMPTWGPFRNAVDEADARCFRAFAACHEAGIPILQSLQLAHAVAPGSRAGQDFARGVVLAQGGSALDAAWVAIQPEHAMRLRAADASGELGPTATRIAEDLTHDVRMRRKRFGAILPIVTMLVVGSIVAFRIFHFYGSRFRDLPGM